MTRKNNRDVSTDLKNRKLRFRDVFLNEISKRYYQNEGLGLSFLMVMSKAEK